MSQQPASAQLEVRGSCFGRAQSLAPGQREAPGPAAVRYCWCQPAVLGNWWSQFEMVKRKDRVLQGGARHGGQIRNERAVTQQSLTSAWGPVARMAGRCPRSARNKGTTERKASPAAGVPHAPGEGLRTGLAHPRRAAWSSRAGANTLPC